MKFFRRKRFLVLVPLLVVLWTAFQVNKIVHALGNSKPEASAYDHRIRVPDMNMSPFDAIVLVRAHGEKVDWLCSGFLISDRVVMTAAHCLDHSPPILGVTVSIPEDYGFMEIDGSKFFISSKYNAESGSHDYGAIILGIPVEREHFVVRPFPEGLEDLETAGFPSDKNKGLPQPEMWRSPLKVSGKNADLKRAIGTNRPMQSGSPVFKLVNGKWEVYGVLDRWSVCCSFFHPIDPETQRVISEWLQEGETVTE